MWGFMMALIEAVLRGRKPRDKYPPALRTLVDSGLAQLRALTAGHQAGWGIGDAENWDIDQDDGYLIFTLPNGLFATCPVQIIGSISEDEGTWLWSWANSSINEELTRDARRVRDYGNANRFESLVAAGWSGTDEDGWDMTAIACKLCDAQGGYRGAMGQSHIFMTFGRVTLSSGEPCRRDGSEPPQDQAAQGSY